MLRWFADQASLSGRGLWRVLYSDPVRRPSIFNLGAYFGLAIQFALMYALRYMEKIVKTFKSFIFFVIVLGFQNFCMADPVNPFAIDLEDLKIQVQKKLQVSKVNYLTIQYDMKYFPVGQDESEKEDVVKKIDHFNWVPTLAFGYFSVVKWSENYHKVLGTDRKPNTGNESEALYIKAELKQVGGDHQSFYADMPINIQIGAAGKEYQCSGIQSESFICDDDLAQEKTKTIVIKQCNKKNLNYSFEVKVDRKDFFDLIRDHYYIGLVPNSYSAGWHFKHYVNF